MCGVGIDIKDYLMWSLVDVDKLDWAERYGGLEEDAAGFFYKQDAVAKSPGKALGPRSPDHCASTLREVALLFRYRVLFA